MEVEVLVDIENLIVPVSGCYSASPLASSTSLQLSVQGYPITVGGGGSFWLQVDQIQLLVQ
jgi:hypothetical protein